MNLKYNDDYEWFYNLFSSKVEEEEFFFFDYAVIYACNIAIDDYEASVKKQDMPFEDFARFYYSEEHIRGLIQDYESSTAVDLSLAYPLFDINECAD